MGVYNQAVITNAGETLIAAAIAGGNAITFSAMQTSDVAIPDGTDLKTLTALPSVAQAIDGQAVNAYVLGQNLVQVSGRFSNTQIEVAYYVQAIGVFARSGSSDVLVAVATAVTPDEMPVYNPLSPTALIYNIQLSIQDADTMTISVDDTGTASIADIARLEGEIAKKIDILGGDASDAVITTAVPNATSVPVPAAGDTFKVILGKIQKFFADLKKAFTGVSASGRTITFTAADGSTEQITTQDTWNANTRDQAGYVEAPTSSKPYYFWATDANGAPAWRASTVEAAYDHRGLMSADAFRKVYNRKSTDGSYDTDNVGKFYGVSSSGVAGWLPIPVKNDATTTAEGYVLDARMGKTINDKIDSLIQTSSLTVTGGNDLLYYSGNPIGPSRTNGYFFIIMHPVGNSNRAGIYVARTYDKNLTTIYEMTNATVGFSAQTGNLYVRSSADTGGQILYTIIRMVNSGNI